MLTDWVIKYVYPSLSYLFISELLDHLSVSQCIIWSIFIVTIRVIQVYAPTSNAEEAEVEWFYEDLQDLLELTPLPKKMV